MIVNETEVITDLCKKSFPDFCKEFWSEIVPEKLVWNWHMEYLALRAQAIFERIFKSEPKKFDLVANVPPGSSKSTILSILLNGWAWTRMPSLRFCGASYAHSLSLELSRKTRDLVKSEKYRECFPYVKLRADMDTKTNFQTTKGGMRYACGSGGAVVGFHFHAIVIDDPIDPQMSVSDAEMENVHNWIEQTLNQRKVDSSISVMIQVAQRLGVEDPSAKMLEKKKVSHIRIPGTDDYKVHPNSLRKYYINGLMDPVRFPREVLDEKKLTLGEYGYAAQFGQDPIPLSGGMFKVDRLKVGTPPDKFRQVTRFWDKAASTGLGKGGKVSYTVGCKMGLAYNDDLWVLDIQRFRFDTARREQKIMQMAALDGKECVVGVEQEPGSGGKESAENTQTRLSLEGFICKILVVRDDKEIRADPFSTLVNLGRCHLAQAPWNKEYVDELRNFPMSKIKDQVDASSGAFSLLTVIRPRVGGIKPQSKDNGIWKI
jgi:predicted phage terminase large subunit-like protein